MTDDPDAPAEFSPAGRPARAFAQRDAGVLRAVATIAALALVAAVGWWWTGRSSTSEVVSRVPSESIVSANPASAQPPTPSALPPGGSPAPGPGGSATPGVVVDVRGAVRSPGVQQLPAGARVLDAIDAAGGLKPGRAFGQVNLARVLVDGEQVVVGRAAATAAPAAAAPPIGGGSTSPVAVLDLNTATAEQLETLNGVGPVLAGEIIAWRTQHGGFTSVDDLLDVSGIGDKTLAGLRDSVRVG